MVQVETSEARLKAAVIDRLVATGIMAEDSVLISEMTVAHWSRRADIVVANGRLWGFELKSAADRLTRLPAQIDAFLKYYEKLVIVSAARFENEVRAIIDAEPSGRIGLWVEGEDGVLIERKRPRAATLAKSAAVELMTAEELRRILTAHGAKNLSALHRAGLEAEELLDHSAAADA